MSRWPETSEDAGPVYVREKGKLFVIGSQISKSKTRPFGLFSKGFSVELCMNQGDACKQREKPYFFTYTEQGSLRYSAKPLFILTLDLIANNIQHVDSLIGFPEQVAEKLFAAAEVRQKFHAPGSGLASLQKFTEAYGDLMLSSLCLRGRHLLVSEKLEEIMSFQGLRSLDLSHCKLGDEHELIGHFTTDALSSLTELYLKDNCLSDAGIRKMTAPVRVLHRGLGSLTVLDMSDNPGVTDLGVTFLFAFKTLNFLDISGTGIKDAAVKKIEARYGLKHSKDPLLQFDHVNCTTRGWAEQLFDQWESRLAAAIKPKETPKSRAAAQQFYGKEKIIPEKDLDVCAVQNPLTNQPKRLQFYRTTEQKVGLPSGHITGHGSIKRPHKEETQACPTPSSKRPCLSLSEQDWELLNSY
ncbi:leucine-rich repeat-containing protein 42 [Spea bombifrons]|uniref:leucine-rich repeat-containing protein 42 n=1 Tax=Spea bombifrons TaxID=233779 RepID=UPI0023498E05|nr:leucine-rich repeat-containing protein 42 [Spea bombifrons]